ncbi:MAG: hypothetical protein K1X57_07710 [Gemmataceae bacterium]|nr:hypothetical protein [Gemmataceae bacterium]
MTTRWMVTVAFFSLAMAGPGAAQPKPVDPSSPEPHPPVGKPATLRPADLNRSLLRFVEDNSPVRSETENPDEARAYDYIVGFARQVGPADFLAAARKEITFANMLGPDSAKYRGEVVIVEGRLKRIRDLGPTRALEADGVKHLYEAWVFSEIYREYSYCVLLTDLPAGIPVSEQLDRRVTLAGFFYKIYRFRAGDGYRIAPLIVGGPMTERVLPPVEPSPQDAAFASVPLLLIALIAFGVVVFGLVLAFRMADRRNQARVAAARNASPPEFRDINPFPGSPSAN